jgi:hypothetical protein
MWCIPKGQDGAFICSMEDVLDLYEEPHDPKRPVVGFEERPTQLFQEVIAPIPAKPKEELKKENEATPQSSPVVVVTPKSENIVPQENQNSVTKQDNPEPAAKEYRP